MRPLCQRKSWQCFWRCWGTGRRRCSGSGMGICLRISPSTSGSPSGSLSRPCWVSASSVSSFFCVFDGTFPAHPNCKLFISHGGLLSTTETVSLGVPVLAIPIFADQKLNAGRIQAKGFGLTIPFSQMTPSSLNTALDDLLDNPKYVAFFVWPSGFSHTSFRYRRNVQMGSRLLHDRPIQPMELADYWIRYVVRHKGAQHLRVAGIQLPLFRYFMLDQLGVFLGVLTLVGWLLCRTRKVLCKRKPKAKKEWKSEGSKAILFNIVLIRCLIKFVGLSSMVYSFISSFYSNTMSCFFKPVAHVVSPMSSFQAIVWGTFQRSSIG